MLLKEGRVSIEKPQFNVYIPKGKIEDISSKFVLIEDIQNLYFTC